MEEVYTRIDTEHISFSVIESRDVIRQKISASANGFITLTENRSKEPIDINYKYIVSFKEYTIKNSDLPF